MFDSGTSLARPRNEDFGYYHKSKHRDGQSER